MSAPFPFNPLPGDDDYDEGRTQEEIDDEYYDEYDPYADEYGDD